LNYTIYILLNLDIQILWYLSCRNKLLKWRKTYSLATLQWQKWWVVKLILIRNKLSNQP